MVRDLKASTPDHLSDSFTTDLGNSTGETSSGPYGNGMLALIAQRISCLIVLSGLSLRAAVPFTVVVYNAENLHDADGVALYDDYQPGVYTPRHLATKVTNAAAILTQFRSGAGPDIVLLQEMEIDQTPGPTPSADAFIAAHRGESVADLLAQSPLPADLADLPSELWLLKALADAGAEGYHVVVGSDEPSPPDAESGRVIKCVTLSKFPVLAVHQYATESARNIIETKLDVDGKPLWVFNNHWKSGASDAETEETRAQNAGVLRRRIDEILREDPAADILIGGDLNSQYNQKVRYPQMPRTGLDDVLGVNGGEAGIANGDTRLYNLWWELDSPRRGSDVYRGEWGTLMHLIVSRGLYDQAGVQYQDNSFGVARLTNVNVDYAGVPRRWEGGGANGSGYSDHLPIYAHFRTVDDAMPDRWMALDHPSSGEPDDRVWRVDYAGVDVTAQAVALDALPEGTDLRDGTWNGRLFRVRGSSSVGRDLKVRFGGQTWDVYAPGRDTREALQSQHVRDRRFDFYGELGMYRGNWQFIVQDPSWVR